MPVKFLIAKNLNEGMLTGLYTHFAHICSKSGKRLLPVENRCEGENDDQPALLRGNTGGMSRAACRVKPAAHDVLAHRARLVARDGLGFPDLP